MPDKDIFTPEEDNCGIWHDAPWTSVFSCSIGDKGTTASISAYGDLVQLSQYMGFGRSGIFTLEKPCLEEPYGVCQRYKDLNSDNCLDFTWTLPPDVSFEESARVSQKSKRSLKPRVSWVNWRWPRFEYSTESPDGSTSCNITCQWYAHSNIVLQQLVFKHLKGEEPSVAWIRLQHCLIREGDYLDPSYKFNEIWIGDDGYEDAYTHMEAPHGCGWITLHTLHQGVQNTTSGPDSESTLASVAAVRTIFLNGKPFDDKPKNVDGICGKIRIEHGEKESLEIVVATKLIHLPKGKVDWRNFVISAQEADVSNLLRQETNLEWRASIWNLNLSQRDNVRVQDNSTGSPVATKYGKHNGQALHDQQNIVLNDPQSKAKSAPSPDSNISGSREEPAIAPALKPDTPQVDEDQEPAPNTAFRPPRGVPGDLTARDHIEYLSCRMLEHILSVCAVTLSPPVLVGESKPHEPVAVVLTCGDSSGHRVCTSAS